jgi:hypothetical protein
MLRGGELVAFERAITWPAKPINEEPTNQIDQSKTSKVGALRKEEDINALC